MSTAADFNKTELATSGKVWDRSNLYLTSTFNQSAKNVRCSFNFSRVLL